MQPHLCDDALGLLLPQRLVLPQVGVQVAAGAELQHCGAGRLGWGQVAGSGIGCKNRQWDASRRSTARLMPARLRRSKRPPPTHTHMRACVGGAGAGTHPWQRCCCRSRKCRSGKRCAGAAVLCGCGTHGCCRDKQKITGNDRRSGQQKQVKRWTRKIGSNEGGAGPEARCSALRRIPSRAWPCGLSYPCPAGGLSCCPPGPRPPPLACALRSWPSWPRSRTGPGHGSCRPPLAGWPGPGPVWVVGGWVGGRVGPLLRAAPRSCAARPGAQ